MLIARLFGTRSVADLVKALEGDEEEAYDAQGASPEVAAIAADEREHARDLGAAREPASHSRMELPEARIVTAS